MGMKNRQYETMTRVHVGRWAVRVWCASKEFAVGPNIDIRTALHAAQDALPTGKWITPEQICKVLDDFEHVAAYEILAHSGDGGLVYPDWG